MEAGDNELSHGGRTFRLELLRSLPQGVIETCGATFAMFIAIRVFDASVGVKMVIGAAASVGLLLSIFTVPFVRRLGCSVNVASAVMWVLASIGFAIAAMSGTSPAIYLTGVSIAAVCLAMAVPLMSQIYRRHYPDSARGKMFSIAAMSRSVAGALAGWQIGLWVKHAGDHFHGLFWCYAGSTMLMAVCVLLMARVKLRRSVQLRLFEAFEHVGKDAQFRKLLISWMLLGFGNLLSFALFVEFISNPSYGFALEGDMAGLVTSTIPMVAFILFVVPWGMVFDRLPFYRVRVITNLIFLAGILVFYLGGSFVTLCIGMMLHGIARSGGNVIWSLWVTRFAEADRVGEYMSVHTCLTGFRGTLAPVIAFLAAGWIGPSVVAISSGVLILVSSAMLIPELRAEWRAR